MTQQSDARPLANMLHRWSGIKICNNVYVFTLKDGI